ncbi:hypothetical protein A2574_00335 [Candidatus Shapirobacteria bacterium RIFOXYD1_FULL_38_32]|uniref:Nucleoid-associated protein n=3 Tax=Candidatus Shapironibacteriota TaxID=1752721 RepID=A0A0G0JKY1_9BACT|nr:MAG: hypothetical protein US90_C0025G0017 [Candidatus Shapirobacteria bacterium GW2011_GWE2_38_30]OGL56123.1 MAG: hypothetical protein A2367_00265 [Candidatus Shapirobacteria bacterium RIFOXYB1_FULL_38_38]OGL56237.1 MAG: hypothetical protein A2195_00785 [Candidatus Shapirobacteria bacterium RIFOXYA1_FULL_39_17]OGL57722.1 MAG: hypothetical protein A2410_02745 [Candidatus Shapirobacteria bacterium RIFOXYC1_FULL_38_24]OGL58034.1 MAG: hypothetical protein A2574_00335 [Candidatus Shapirobacteria 
MFDKAKAGLQFMKIKKAVESESVEVEDSGVRVIISGFVGMGISEPKVKLLSVNGVENKVLLDTLNKALKKSLEVSAKKLKDMSGELQGMAGM